MATSTGRDRETVGTSDVDVLLHPELLSQDFIRLILSEKNVRTRGCENRDRLTELYLRHVIPLPQRSLPSSRWGKRMERSRGREPTAGHSNDHGRKRPLIVYDGSSSHTGPLKVKKPEGQSTTSTAGITDRLKPPPAANLSNPIRRLSGSTSSTSSSSLHPSTNNLKREANGSNAIKSPELKKKIQHVTWP